MQASEKLVGNAFSSLSDAERELVRELPAGDLRRL
jgi:hypothetical protein